MSQKGRRARSEILSHSLPATHAALREWTGRPSHLSRCPTTPVCLTATARLARPTTSVARMRCKMAANACPTCPLTTRTMAPLPLVWPPCTAPCWAIAVRQTFTPIHEPSALTSDPHRPGDEPRDRAASVNQSIWGRVISLRQESKDLQDAMLFFLAGLRPSSVFHCLLFYLFTSSSCTPLPLSLLWGLCVIWHVCVIFGLFNVKG